MWRRKEGVHAVQVVEQAGCKQSVMQAEPNKSMRPKTKTAPNGIACGAARKIVTYGYLILLYLDSYTAVV